MNKQIKENSSNEITMKLEKVSKSYNTKDKCINVLNDISIELYEKQFYAVMGHSGSGKSTFINILGLNDTIDTGSYKIYGIESSEYNDVEISKLKMKNIGFVFQEFYLNPTLKAFENVMVPMLINKEIKPKERKTRACELLKSVGLENRINHYPSELSGGEQQRVAIARCLANNPSIILADEPTGNLDEENEKEIFKLLKSLSQEGKCIVVVSHSNEVKRYADKIYIINNGKLGGENL